MSKIFLISDEHYKHEKILQYERRPFRDTKEMQYALISKHNAVVGKDDVTYHLGDVFWGDNWKELAAVLKRLNGEHHLIIGNHDHIHWHNYLEAGFTSVHTSLQIDDYILTHDPAVAGVLKDRKFIHGHTHSLGKRLGDNTYCVCVELHYYTPVSLDKIREEFI